MKIRRLSRLFVFLAIVAMALSACETKEVAGECEKDGDCDSGFRCSPDRRCLCIDDDSCAEDEYCNLSGYCQPFSGCRMDSDCGNPTDFECRVSVSGHGTCLCRTDQACAEGEMCTQDGICEIIVGCQTDADCGDPDDWLCQPNAAGINECRCETDNACSEGEFCNEFYYCQPEAVCTDDMNCPEGQMCDVESGECLCRYVEQTGCIEGEICNELGYCQPIPGCYTNEDCIVPNTYCDVVTSKCVPDGTCNSDLQCPLEHICDAGLRECVPGCRTNVDCPLDKFCQGGSCVAGCQADMFCDMTELCLNNACVDQYTPQRPYCKPCGALMPDCGDAENWCVIYNNGPDDFSAQYDNYCAPTCNNGEPCPHGWNCGELIVISAECGPTANGCPGPTCMGGVPCLQSEEEECGFCPCAASNPCPQDMCFFGTCLQINRPCTTDADCAIDCVLYEGETFGRCVVSSVCGLQEGFHCPLP